MCPSHRLATGPGIHTHLRAAALDALMQLLIR
jgi:hypothetical protein